jgi:hypothetical protein
MIEHKVYIVDIDYWEKDAILQVGDERYYFQFRGDVPTVEEAIEYISDWNDTKVK